MIPIRIDKTAMNVFTRRIFISFKTIDIEIAIGEINETN